MNNILEKTRIYLVGSIEAAQDSGYGWRETVTEEFEKMGIRALNPCVKPFRKDIELDETDDFQAEMKTFREEGNWDELAKRMKEIRIYDLKLVDIADAIFVYVDADIPTCGSWEEIFAANKMKKPIFFVYKQGKAAVPTWLFGTFSHKYFYGSIEDALQVIREIDSGDRDFDSDRWKLLRKEFR